jgi:phage-related baseplate assembly protein
VPLALPNLDDLTWQQLTEEGRSLISAWAPEWTNHNVSDPGMTLVEMFAYLSEILIYRLNRVSDANLLAFLRLINGRDWSTAKDLHRAKRETVNELRRPQRAVTAEDFEKLTRAVNETLGPGSEERVARAKCILRRNLTGGTRAARTLDAPGHVSVVVVSKFAGGRAQPSAGLLRKVREALEPARLLTTRVHVVKPRYVTVSVRITLVIRRDALPETVRGSAVDALERFFDPFEGGTEREGWPFGRNVYVSEVYQLLAKVPGVDYVRKSIDPLTQETLEELAVGPSEVERRKVNRDGQLEAIQLFPDELVSTWIARPDIAMISHGEHLRHRSEQV